MSIVSTLAFDHMVTSRALLSTLGFYGMAQIDGNSNTPYSFNSEGKAFSEYWATASLRGFVPTNPFTPPAKEAAPEITFGARFDNLPLANDVSTYLMGVYFTANPASMKFYFTPNTFQIPSGVTAGYLEVTVNRVARTWTTFIDGVVTNTGTIGSTITDGEMADVWTIYLGTRRYGSVASLAAAMTVRDFYALQDDGVYPSKRLGAVTVKARPVKVSAVNGFTKTAAEVEAILKQQLTTTGTVTSAKLVKANGSATFSATSGNIDFTIDTTGSKPELQVAACITVGAARTTDKNAVSNIQKQVNGSWVTQDAVALDFSTKTSDRLKFGIPMAIKSKQTDTLDLGTVPFRLNLAESA